MIARVWHHLGVKGLFMHAFSGGVVVGPTACAERGPADENEEARDSSTASVRVVATSAKGMVYPVECHRSFLQAQ